MNPNYFKLLFLCPLLFLIGCGEQAPSETPTKPQEYPKTLREEFGAPVELTWAEIENGNLEEGKYISISGFATGISSDSMDFGSGMTHSLGLDVIQYPESESKKIETGISIVGTNTLEKNMGEYCQKTREGYIWIGAEGTKIENGDFVQISGLLGLQDEQKLVLSRIGSLDTDKPADMEAFMASATQLTTTTVSAMEGNRMWGYMEGQAEIPQGVSDGTEIVLRGSQLDQIGVLSLPTSLDGVPNSMKPLVSGLDPLEIHDHRGRQIDPEKALRFYGAITKLEATDSGEPRPKYVFSTYAIAQ